MIIRGKLPTDVEDFYSWDKDPLDTISGDKYSPYASDFQGNSEDSEFWYLDYYDGENSYTTTKYGDHESGSSKDNY